MKYTLTPNSPLAISASGAYHVAIPNEVAANQKAFDGKSFPALILPRNGHCNPSTPRRAKARLRGDLYGLHTAGTGDMVVSIF